MICNFVRYCVGLIGVIWGDDVHDDYESYQDQFIASLHQPLDEDVDDLLQDFLDDALEIVSRGTHQIRFDIDCLDDPDIREMYDECVVLVTQVQDQTRVQARDQAHDQDQT